MVPPEFDPPRDITPGDISDGLVVRLYFDASLSMQGFVVPGSTHYTRMVPCLEGVVLGGWKEATVEFFQFGEEVKDITRNTYLRARFEDFYEKENINRETFIEKIIDREDPLASNQMAESNMPKESTKVVSPTEEVNETRLVIIVTDLFQDNSDINLLINQLKEKFIKNDLEVGLFGLRSQFDGIVYDTGVSEEPLPHQSDPEDSETYRPFYLLVLGRHADIAHYFYGLKAKGFPEAKTIIFSRYLVSPSLSFDDSPIELDNLNNTTFVRSEDPRLKQYEIWKDSNPAKISATFDYVPLPHVMFFDSNALEPVITGKHKLQGETKISRKAGEYLEVKSTLSKNEGSNELSVDFSLDSQALPKEKVVYLYEVTLSPNVDKYEVPSWCSDWDMGARLDGSKTLNLVNFVRDLSQVTARMHRPKIAKFYFYIGKR